jgi:hypothetical protein
VTGINFRRHGQIQGEEIRKNLTAVNWSPADARQHPVMIAAAQSNKRPTSHVMSVAKFERFFRIAAGLDVDKQDLKRYSDFINRKLYDLLVRAEAVAKANGRVVIEPFDLPITKGLQQSIDEFENIDEEIELRPILEHPAGQPPLELAYGEDIEDQLPVFVGGLSVALARAFKIIDGDLKNPATRHWQQCFRIFDLLM